MAHAPIPRSSTLPSRRLHAAVRPCSSCTRGRDGIPDPRTRAHGRGWAHLLDLAARRAQHRAPTLRSVRTSPTAAPHMFSLSTRSRRGWSWGNVTRCAPCPAGGSTAAYLTHYSACPLLVHRGAAAERGPVAAGVRLGTHHLGGAMLVAFGLLLRAHRRFTATTIHQRHKLAGVSAQLLRALTSVRRRGTSGRGGDGHRGRRSW